MKEKEVLVSTSKSGISVWDPKNATKIASYGQELASMRSLCVLGRDYFLSADMTDSLLHIWPICNNVISDKEIKKMHTPMPSKVSALAVDGSYCVGAVDNEIYVWQISTGHLYRILSRHFQQVTTIKFTDDGSHFVSAGNDGQVLVWLLTEVLSSKTDIEPRHVWNEHALPVTDMCVGKGGWRARIVTASLDRTCRMFSIASGKMLWSVTFPVASTALALDPDESVLFVGGRDGRIYQMKLTPLPRTYTSCLDTEEMKNCVFGDQGASISCLTVNASGSHLASSSFNGIKIWNIGDKECVQMLPLDGSITNMLYMLSTESTFTSESCAQTLPILRFKEKKTDRSSIAEVNVKPSYQLNKVWTNSNGKLSLTNDASSELRDDNLRLRASNKKLADLCRQRLNRQT